MSVEPSEPAGAVAAKGFDPVLPAEGAWTGIPIAKSVRPATRADGVGWGIGAPEGTEDGVRLEGADPASAMVVGWTTGGVIGGAGGTEDRKGPPGRLCSALGADGGGGGTRSPEVSIMTSKGTSVPQAAMRARPMGPRDLSMMSLANEEPATRTRVPSTSMTRVMRMMDTLPWPSSPEAARTSRAERHLVTASSSTWFS